MTVAELVTLAGEAAGRFPQRTELVKNEVGNLSVVLDGEYLGYLDLRSGEVVSF